MREIEEADKSEEYCGFRLSTGRDFYACGNLLSVYERYAGEWTVSYGSDGSVDTDEWTPAEREELADYMIAQWQAFKVAAQGVKPR